MRLSLFTTALLLSAGVTFAAPIVHIRDSQPPLSPRQLQQIKAYIAGHTKNAAGALSPILATFGREDLAARLRRPNGKICQPLLRGGKQVSPLDFIAKAAAKTRAVIINEAEDAPQDRAFIMDLAERLHPEGYTLYGAENFARGTVLRIDAHGRRQHKTISLVPEIGPPWPMRYYGFYVSEPTFGKLLRNLRGDHDRFFSYDAPTAQTQQRTQIQRTNLRESKAMARIARKLKAEPKETKLLLHVSYAHAFEKPGKDGKIWLAERFRAATKINPLSISQTAYHAPGNHYVICDPAQLKHKPRTDMTLGVPQERFVRGRPAWRLKRGEHFFKIPQSLRRPQQLAIYRAIFAGEPDGAVAADQLLLRPGDHLPLLLPAGIFRLYLWTEQSGWSAPVKIRVAG